MKKKTIVIAALAVVLAILGTGTLAYFTSRTVTHNVITTDGIKIQLEEYFPGAVPDGDNSFVLEGVMPGMDVTKEVRVLNKEATAWIRVRVELGVTGSREDLDADAVTDIDYNLGTGEDQWTQEGEWFYYNSPVPTGAYTSYLFREVSFSGPEMGNEYQNAEFTVDVHVQAVQAANNDPVVDSDVTTVQGWPND